MDDRMIQLFETYTLFPLQGLKSRKTKSSAIYMNMSRFVPQKMKTADLIDHLCYVLNDLSRTKDQCQRGVALIVKMEGWTMDNFSYVCYHQFVQALQGKHVPTKVELLVMVNAPPAFMNVWKNMKKMFSKSLARKAHMIKENRLKEFLVDGYQQYLPEEFARGWKDTYEIIEDYIDAKEHLDQ